MSTGISGNEARPLPPRALPPIQNGDGSQITPARTPRKRPITEGSKRRIRAGTRTKEPVTPRSQDETVEPSNVTEERSTNHSGFDDSRPDSERRTRTKRRRKRPPANRDNETEEAGLANEHKVSNLVNEEDVVNVERIDDAVVLTNLPGAAAGGGGSAVGDKVYVQTANGFASHNLNWIAERDKAAGSESRLMYGEDAVRASHIAARNEKGFMFLTLMLHGILSGLAIWHVVITYTLLGVGENSFLTQYQSLAQPTQAVFHIILVLCTISALDRYDFAGADKSLLRSLVRFDLASWGAVIYFFAVMFSIGMAGLDVWLGSGVGITTDSTSSPGTTTLIPSVLTGEDLDVPATINSWLILNVFRAVFASLGWLIIAVDPQRNDMKWEE